MKFQARDLKLKVVALFPSNPALPGDYVVTPDTLAKGGLAPLDAMVMVTKDPGASTNTVRDEIDGVVKDLPTVTVKDPEGFAAEQKEADQPVPLLDLRPARALGDHRDPGRGQHARASR